jgi:hypothetical protein
VITRPAGDLLGQWQFPPFVLYWPAKGVKPSRSTEAVGVQPQWDTWFQSLVEFLRGSAESEEAEGAEATKANGGTYFRQV